MTFFGSTGLFVVFQNDMLMFRNDIAELHNIFVNQLLLITDTELHMNGE